MFFQAPRDLPNIQRQSPEVLYKKSILKSLKTPVYFAKSLRTPILQAIASSHSWRH